VHARARRSTGPVDRPPPPLTVRSTGSANWPAPCVVSRSFVCATSFHLFYLLSPTILHLGEGFPNLSRSPTNPSLSPGEIDTRSQRNRHIISACTLQMKSTHDLGEIDTRSRLEICSSAIHWNAPHMPSLHFTLSELPYKPITERVSYSATSRPHEELIMS